MLSYKSLKPVVSRTRFQRSSLRPRTRLLGWLFVTAFVVLAASTCAAPYMTAQDCADFCHAEGKQVGSYTTGSQIPIVHPRPSTRCICEAPSVQ